MDPIPVELHDGEYSLLLRLDEIRALQDALGDVGFGTIYRRTFTHDFKIDDLVEVIRLGLIGGDNDMSPAVAKRKAMSAATAMPIGDLWQIAIAALKASYMGYKKSEETRVDKETSDLDDAKFDMASAIDFGRRCGFTPAEMRTMTIADYVALVEGWNAENDDSVPPPSATDHEAWLASIGDKPDEKVAA